MGNKESSPGISDLLKREGGFGGVNSSSLLVGGGINTYDDNGLTGLHRAILEGSLIGVKQLIDMGADPKVKTKQGWSCFHLAAKSGNMEIMAILLGKGVSVDDKSKEEVHLDDKKIVFVGGSTALHVASQIGNTKVAHLLVSLGQGAEKVKNDEGKTPEEVARSYNQGEVVRMLKNDIVALRVDFERHKEEVEERFRNLEHRLAVVERRGAQASIYNVERKLNDVEKRKIKENFYKLMNMNVKQMICLLYDRCLLNCEDIQSLRSLQGAEELQKKFIINKKLVDGRINYIAKVKDAFKDSGHDSMVSYLP